MNENYLKAIESELNSIQSQINDIGDTEIKRSTEGWFSPLKFLALRIGCCRAGIKNLIDTQQTKH